MLEARDEIGREGMEDGGHDGMRSVQACDDGDAEVHHFLVLLPHRHHEGIGVGGFMCKGSQKRR